MELDYTDKQVEDLTDALSKDYWIQETPSRLRLQQKYLNRYREVIGVNQSTVGERSFDLSRYPLYNKLSDAEDRRSSMNKSVELTPSIKRSKGRSAGRVRFTDESTVRTSPSIEFQQIPPRPSIPQRKASSAQQQRKFTRKLITNELFLDADQPLWSDDMLVKYRNQQRQLFKLQEHRTPVPSKFKIEISSAWTPQCESLDEQVRYDRSLAAAVKECYMSNQQQISRHPNILDALRENPNIQHSVDKKMAKYGKKPPRKSLAPGSINANSKQHHKRMIEHINRHDRSRSLSSSESRYLSLYSWNPHAQKTPSMNVADTSSDMAYSFISKKHSIKIGDFISSTKQ